MGFADKRGTRKVIGTLDIVGEITVPRWSMKKSAADGPGTVSSSLNFSLGSPAWCFEDIAGTLVLECFNSIGYSDRVDISRLFLHHPRSTHKS